MTVTNIFRVGVVLLAGLAGGAARADCLEDLLPRPRRVVRGAEPAAEALPARAGAYRLTVRAGRPDYAGDAEGRRYARATFEQLRRLAGGRARDIPDCVIDDWPEFRWRGLMLDCGRNWQSVESIKDILDMLARYKMNVFHWHLTDNHGWRLESKVLPQLQKDGAFERQVGKYYTQKEFREVLYYAYKRGITVIPELDMPGHTRAFRKAMGIADMSDPRVKDWMCQLIDELCALAKPEAMPVVHLGTDEARAGERVPQAYLDAWAARVRANGRQLMGWSPGLRMPGQSVKQLWKGADDPRGDGCAYVDSQNSYYINHVDPEELLSVAAYQQPCRWGAPEEKLGAIVGVWHDDRIAETEDVVRMNAVYPAIALLSDNFWRGRERDEPTLYARLPPPDDPRFALAADLERRLVVHRDRVVDFVKHPFPYVAQTAMRWRLSDASGRVLAKDIPQATVYPRHFWFPAAAYVPYSDGTVVLETWIESPSEMDCGAWIDLCGFSRSDGRTRDAPTPQRGQWNKHGATVELNGRPVAPPEWRNPGARGDLGETPLVDEGYWYRPPARIHLRKGTNHVKLTMPKRGGWKWIGTFVPVVGTSDRPHEVKGLVYRSEP